MIAQHKDLSVLERGEQLEERKAIYEELYPETKAGISQALGSNAAQGNNVSETISPTFTEDTAEKTGQSRRTIEQEIQISKNISPEVKDKIRSLPLD